jgi:hypothetical protein
VRAAALKQLSATISLLKSLPADEGSGRNFIGCPTAFGKVKCLLSWKLDRLS